MARKTLIAAALCVSLGLVALWVSQLDWSIVARGDNDFAMIYTGAKLAGTPSPYSFEEFQQTQKQFASVHSEHVLFARPPHYAFLLKPLALLPYSAAYVVFTLLNLAAFGVFLYWFAPRTSSGWRAAYWLAGAASIPVLTAFVLGQDVMLLLLICGAAVLLVRKNIPFAAGMLLALLTIKPHMFLMLPVLLIARKEWRVFLGGAVGGAVLFVISTITQGWNWPGEYFGLLRQSEDAVGYTLPNLRGLLMATIGENIGVELALAAAVLALVAIASRQSADFETAFAAAIVAGLLVSHHAYIQDCCLLLAVSAFAVTNPRLRIAALVLMTPPFYFLLGAGAASVLLPAGLLFLLIVSVLPGPF